MKKFKAFITEKKELFFIMNKDGNLYAPKDEWVKDKKTATSYKSWKEAQTAKDNIKKSISARNMEVIADKELV